MNMQRVAAFDHGGAASLHPGSRWSRIRMNRMFGLAVAGLIVVALGVANQAQSAQATVDLTRAKELAIAQVGHDVGIGAAGADINGFRDAAASSLAAGAVADVRELIGEAGAELGVGPVAALVTLRNGVIAEVGAGAHASTLSVAIASLRGEQAAVTAALVAHRADTARIAAEAAAAETARLAADAETHARAQAAEAASGSAESDASNGSVDAAASAAADAPYTAEYYPGLPAAPRDEDCGPCTGKPMYPVAYNGGYVWGCAV